MPNQQDWQYFDLPERATISNDGGLKAFLDASRPAPVRVSAKNARKLDTLVLQILLAAAQSWRKRDLGFELSDVPEWLSQQLDWLGVKPEYLTRKVAE